MHGLPSNWPGPLFAADFLSFSVNECPSLLSSLPACVATVFDPFKVLNKAVSVGLCCVFSTSFAVPFCKKVFGNDPCYVGLGFPTQINLAAK